jgi:hypothetical protein
LVFVVEFLDNIFHHFVRRHIFKNGLQWWSYSLQDKTGLKRDK